jgi:hypothetical protein
MNNVLVKCSTMFNNVPQCVIKFLGVSSCNKSPFTVHYHYNISSGPSEVMTTKTKVGLFLMTGLVLAVAAIYSSPMQQATACRSSCDGGGGGGGGDCCGGSLVNVEDNNVGSNIGNVETGDTLSGNKILSGNKLKTLNDVNVLSKNYLNDFNVLSKNSNNQFLNNILSENLDDNNVAVSDVANDLEIHGNIVKHNNLGTSVLSDYFKQICGC